MTTATVPTSVESLLQCLVRIDSVNTIVSGRADAERRVAEEIESLAQAMGLITRRMPIAGSCHNVLVTHTVAEKLPWLMFESHMDTVTVEGMTIDPFGAKIEGNRLWGRGSCDTKGTGAAMLWALHKYAALSAAKKPNNIAIAFVIDEEYGMTGVRALGRDHWRTLGFTPTGVIVGEPTLLRPVVTHNGAVRWKVTTRGVAAHSSDPSKGRSAITSMVKVINAIEGTYIPSLSASDEMTGKAQCSVNLIQGGTQINIIPAVCEIRLDRRVVPGEDAKSVVPAVDQLLGELQNRDATVEYSQEELFSCPPLTRRHNASLQARVQKVLSKLGLPADALGTAYATDAGDLDALGIPAIVIGPGDLTQAHTKDEWIDLDQLRGGVEVYLALMRN